MMLQVADTLSLSISCCLRQKGRKFLQRASLISDVNGCFRQRSFSTTSIRHLPKQSSSPAAAFHFASTDYSNCFPHAPQTPNPNDVLRTSALHYLKHVFDPSFWFKDPVRHSNNLLFLKRLGNYVEKRL
jgi:hypothetical protein